MHLAEGTNVETNEKTKAAAEDALGVKGSRAASGLTAGAIEAAVKKGMLAALKQVQDQERGKPKASGAGQEVVLKLNERELARGLNKMNFHQGMPLFGRTET